MSTANGETRFSGYPGGCFRCGGIDHWADNPSCPWTVKAATMQEHEKRIGSLGFRYSEYQITGRQKREYINQENKLWYDGRVPSRLA